MDRPETLDELFVEAVETPGRYGDGRGGYGLSLLVKLSVKGGVTKSFAQRVRIDNVPHNLGLGPYPAVSLQEAAGNGEGELSESPATPRQPDPGRLAWGSSRRFRSRPRSPLSFAPFLQRRPSRSGKLPEQVIAVNRATWRAGGKSEKQWRAVSETSTCSPR